MQQTNTPSELKTNGHLIHSLRLSCDSWNTPSFFASCPASLPFLTSLEFKGQFYGGIGEFEELIKRGVGLTSVTGGWKRLVFCVEDEWECIYQYTRSFFDTLIQHAASTVEVLRFEGNSETNSADISRLLCSAPNLREFQLVNDGMYRAGEYLTAHDVVSSDWVCTDLEVFACPIVKLPRPDITRNILGRPATEFVVSGTLEESIDLQRRVYAKLARLTKLRELALGNPVPTDNVDYQTGDKEACRQYDCLAMTLDSGLNLLKDLRELRVIGLEDMEIYIDNDREQSWFAEHWPNATIGSTVYHTDRDYDGYDYYVADNYYEDMDGVGFQW
ncbi:MAG: hypothetical protein J3R72DRAFT_428896 [Linnemannia gamsii]|nr:MAG: hypothetical protein J3R72DRAFT_428896 [Linnemannia gamsii]